MNSNNIQIEKLDAKDLEIVAQMLADTFTTNPAYASIFSNKGKLWNGLLWLFRTNLFLLNKRASVTSLLRDTSSKEIIGVYSLLPPEGVQFTIADYLQVGIPQFIFKFGFRPLVRMLELDSLNKKQLKDVIGVHKYYYISMVAIRKSYRGTGLGSMMLKDCLDKLTKENRTCCVVGLTTQLPENVEFYSRLGFHLLDEKEIQFRESKYYNYNMRLDL